MSSGEEPPPRHPQTIETSSSETSKDLADCLLSQYRFCAAGVGLGSAYTLKYKKGLIPMIAAGAVGTSADLAHGFLVECLEFRQSENNDKPS